MKFLERIALSSQVDLKRISVFLLATFGIAWGVALIILLTGGIEGSPVIVNTPTATINLALILIATVFMWSPAIAHLLTRIITREGWAGMGIKPNLRRGWRYWLAAWILPFVLTVLGIIVYFAAFPRLFDRSLESLQADQPIPFSPWMILVINTLAAFFLTPLVNGVFAFGEEFGWRAYLQPKLMPLGGRKAMLLIGIIWGVWHWPLITMGHTYGVDYPGFPWSAMAAITLFTVTAGTLLGWATLRAGSVWPGVLGHGVINGTAGLGVVLVADVPNLLVGPGSTGILAGIPFALFALWILLRPGALTSSPPNDESNCFS